jgi:hypothetical protein
MRGIVFFSFLLSLRPVATQFPRYMLVAADVLCGYAGIFVVIVLLMTILTLRLIVMLLTKLFHLRP